MCLGFACWLASGKKILTCESSQLVNKLERPDFLLLCANLRIKVKRDERESHLIRLIQEGGAEGKGIVQCFEKVKKTEKRDRKKARMD